MNSRKILTVDASILKIDEVVKRLNGIWGIASVRLSDNEMFVTAINKDNTDYAQAVINTEFKGIEMTYKRPTKKLVKAFHPAPKHKRSSYE